MNPDPPEVQETRTHGHLTLAPWWQVEERLREARPGKGRQSVGLLKGASNAFALDPRLAEGVRQELAWSSFALLKNTNICSVIVHSVAQGAIVTLK